MLWPNWNRAPVDSACQKQQGYPAAIPSSSLNALQTPCAERAPGPRSANEEEVYGRTRRDGACLGVCVWRPVVPTNVNGHPLDCLSSLAAAPIHFLWQQAHFPMRPSYRRAALFLVEGASPTSPPQVPTPISRGAFYQASRSTLIQNLSSAARQQDTDPFAGSLASTSAGRPSLCNGSASRIAKSQGTMPHV